MVGCLLVEDARLIVGQYLVIDGGIEAAWLGHALPVVSDIAMVKFRLMQRPS